MKTATLTVERLVAVLKYEPATGKFIWLHGKFRGAEAGTRHGEGYIQIQVDGVIHKAHRLARLVMTGVHPDGEVDHKNGVRDDNRWINLRLANDSINAQNRRTAQRNSKTGVLGVSPRQNGRFHAVITVGGTQRSLGVYGDIESASAAYVKAKRELHEGCTL